MVDSYKSHIPSSKMLVAALFRVNRIIHTMYYSKKTFMQINYEHKTKVYAEKNKIYGTVLMSNAQNHCKVCQKQNLPSIQPYQLNVKTTIFFTVNLLNC